MIHFIIQILWWSTTRSKKWLVEKIEHFFSDAEQSGEVTQAQVDQLYVLVGALRVLGLEGAAQSFVARLAEVKKRLP